MRYCVASPNAFQHDFVPVKPRSRFAIHTLALMPCMSLLAHSAYSNDAITIAADELHACIASP